MLKFDTDRCWTKNVSLRMACNLIEVEWLDLKDRGNVNKVNIKHVVTDKVEVNVNAVIRVKFGTRTYTAKVVSLLLWKRNSKRNRTMPKKALNSIVLSLHTYINKYHII